MTDQEITEIIATKVMGWALDEPMCWWCDGVHAVEPSATFSPLTSDADCMMAWDRFAEKEDTSLCTDEGKWECCVYSPDDGTECLILVLNKDRRRAMCECMVKAVSQ